MSSVWLPKGITPEQENLLMDMAATQPALAQRVADTFAPPPPPVTRRAGIKPTVPIEYVDAVVSKMTFEQIIIIKQFACRDTVRAVLDAEGHSKSVTLRWRGSRENRRRLIDAVIARVHHHAGGPVTYSGMTLQETAEAMLAPLPPPVLY